jgi:hypothetical protein
VGVLISLGKETGEKSTIRGKRVPEDPEVSVERVMAGNVRDERDGEWMGREWELTL